MDKQFYDKYGKEFHCATCQELTTCVNRPEPLFPNCCEQYLRDRIAELEEQLKKSLESNNDLLKQIMELEAQLIKERLKGENK